jgi:hypothetical protein
MDRRLFPFLPEINTLPLITRGLNGSALIHKKFRTAALACAEKL